MNCRGEEMKRSIAMFILVLAGCSTSNPFSSKLEDYQGDDFSVLQTKNYLDTKISFYEKNESKNCLIKKETKVLNNVGIFNSSKFRMNNNSPFSYLGKSVLEYNLKPNQYVELSVKPDRGWVMDSIKFKIEPNKYYLLYVTSKNDKYSYRIIDVPKGKERSFSSLGIEYNAKPWDINLCN